MATLSVGGTTVFSGSSIDNGAFSAGHIVQVLQYTNSYSYETQSNSELDLEQSSGVVWEPSITVTSGNKVLIQTAIVVRMGYSGGYDARASMRLYEKKGSGSYAKIEGDVETLGGYDYSGNGLWLKDRKYINYLSSPNTGDLIKYKLTLQANVSSSYLSRSEAADDVSNIILMEVTT